MDVRVMSRVVECVLGGPYAAHLPKPPCLDNWDGLTAELPERESDLRRAVREIEGGKLVVIRRFEEGYSIEVVERKEHL